MTIGGVSEDVVQRWILDPSEYKKGIADVAKLIQQQAKHERDLMTVRAELDKTTSSLGDRMSSLNDMMGKAGISTSLLAGGVGGLVATIGTKLIGALADGAAKFGAFINAGDDFNDTVEENRASVWRMTEATQHMGSAMEVAKFRAKLMASEGLEPTEQQLDDLTRAATNLAAKQKTEWSEAAEKLSNTWQGMGARALKPLNIEIDQNNTLLEKQRQILVGVQSLGEATLTQLEKEKALIKEKDDAYLHLSSTMNDNDTIAAAMNFSQVTRIENEIKWVKSLESGWVTVGKVMDRVRREAASSPNPLDRWGVRQAGVKVDATVGEKPVKRITAESIAEASQEWGIDLGKGERAPLSIREKGRGGSRDKSSPFGIREWVYDSLADIEKRAMEMAEETAERIKKLIQKNRGEDVEAGGERDRLRLGDEFKKFTEQAGRGKTVGKLESTFGGGIFGDKAAEGARKSVRALEEYRTAVQGLNDDMTRFSSGALADFAGGLWSAADAAIQGGDSMGVAMAKMLKATLLGIAGQATVKAIFELAEGFGAQGVTWGIPNPSSINHFASAALYGSIAVVTGAAGLGMSAAMAGGSKSAGAGASASHGTNSYKPSYGSTSKEDKKPIVINVWLGGKNDPAAALYLRQQVQAMAA